MNKNIFKGIRLFVLLFSALLLTHCGGGPNLEDHQPPGKNPKAELTLYDSFGFDFSLSNSMAANLPIITVETVAPFTVNEMPERIEDWIKAIQKYDGEVAIIADPAFPKTRFIGAAWDIAKIAFGLVKEHIIYSQAENYNLDILYKPGTGRVTKFLFKLKEGAEQNPATQMPGAGKQ